MFPQPGIEAAEFPSPPCRTHRFGSLSQKVKGLISKLSHVASRNRRASTESAHQFQKLERPYSPCSTRMSSSVAGLKKSSKSQTHSSFPHSYIFASKTKVKVSKSTESHVQSQSPHSAILTSRKVAASLANSQARSNIHHRRSTQAVTNTKACSTPRLFKDSKTQQQPKSRSEKRAERRRKKDARVQEAFARRAEAYEKMYGKPGDKPYYTGWTGGVPGYITWTPRVYPMDT